MQIARNEAIMFDVLKKACEALLELIGLNHTKTVTTKLR